MKEEKTIAAIATPQGVGGIGVVRISGILAKGVLKKVWKSPRVCVDNFASHRLYLGNVVNPSTGELIDKGLAVWMSAPHSYTGEDVVEIHGHGSPLLMEKILESCLQAGAHLAEPGEFTKRAFLNGKMDLAQAEAVCDVIQASSEEGLKQAKEHLTGKLSERILEFQNEIVRLRAFVEASIDFPEEDIEILQKEGILNRLSVIQVALSQLMATYEEGRIHREGIQTVLVGRPNVGKSSLMNALVGSKRVIVHETPGTTRDIIEEPCQFGGFLFRLFDTAGLRKTQNPVEAMGVSLSKDLLAKADLILWILDGSEPLNDFDLDFLSTIDMFKTIVCVNKIDLGLAFDPQILFLKNEKKEFLLISALRGDGIEELKEKMIRFVRKATPLENTGIRITKQRHKQALENALTCLDQADKALSQKAFVEILAMHLKKAHEFLGLITGANIQEDLLDKIFSEFCIGK